MSNNASSEAAKAVVRRNTEEVQGKGNFDVFEEIFADDFVDHTPQPNMTPDKPGARGLDKAIRQAFPDFRVVIHWQTADGELGAFPPPQEVDRQSRRHGIGRTVLMSGPPGPAQANGAGFRQAEDTR